MFFRKKRREHVVIEPSNNAQIIMNFLGCKCEFFPPSVDDSKLMKAYKSAIKEGKKEGFTPIIVVVSDTLAEWFSDFVDSDSIQLIKEMIRSQSLDDGTELFAELMRTRKEDNEVDEISDDELIGEISDGQPMNEFISYKSYHGGIIETILAYIPVENPYEVFAWVPFGGWNECPDAEDMIKAAHYWYDRHGVVPAVIGHDTLEFSAKPLDVNDAMQTAMEQYVLCPDIVDQGTGTVGTLADSLTKSTVWYFWWD